MRTRISCFAVLIAASAAFALLPFEAGAQQPKAKKGSARDAAVAECIDKARASDPFPSPEASQRRVGVYKACMAQKRMRP
jgi:hypothetical protein